MTDKKHPRYGNAERINPDGSISWLWGPMPYVDGKPAPRIRDRVKSGKALNEAMARQAEKHVEEVATTEDKLVEMEAAKELWRMVSEDGDRIIELRETKEATGRDNNNRNKKDKAEHRREEIRQVWRPGMSAEQVRRAIVKKGGDNHKLRTVQNDMKEMGLSKN